MAPRKAPAPAVSSGLEISDADLLAVLKRKPGTPYTVTMILTVLKQDTGLWDNRAAVIERAARLQERGKCERDWVGTGPSAQAAWKVAPPPPDPAALRA